MSPSSTAHGGHHDTKYVELILHAAFVDDEIWGDMLEPARNTIQALAPRMRAMTEDVGKSRP